MAHKRHYDKSANRGPKGSKFVLFPKEPASYTSIFNKRTTAPSINALQARSVSKRQKPITLPTISILSKQEDEPC